MKIDFSQIVRDVKDNPVQHMGRDMTLGTMCAMALDNVQPRDPDVLERGRLARVVQREEEVEMTTEEIVMIQKAIKEVGPAAVVYDAWTKLEGRQ